MDQMNIVLFNTWQHQAIIWTNVDLLSAKTSEMYLRLIQQAIRQSSFTKMSLEIT